MEKKVFESRNPYCGTLYKVHKSHSREEVNRIVQSLDEHQKVYRRSEYSLRSGYLVSLAKLLERDKDELAKAITQEMGKPIIQAEAEILKCADLCRYYSSVLETLLEPEVIASSATESYVLHEPLGVVLGIMPWNFPFWQVFRFAVPALAAGNAVLLKHASNVSDCAERIESLFTESGFGGVFSHVKMHSDYVQELIAKPEIKAISLTGSELAGRSVAALAGKYIKPAVLELGGSNSLIVLADADIELAAKDAAAGRFQNNGQSCIAVKRILVAGAVYGAFMDQFIREVKRLRLGNPIDRNTDIGPLARESFNHDLLSQVDHSIALGAKRILGGCMQGSIFLATILDEVKPGMPVFDEETFGPVAAVTCFNSVEEAIQLHNLSPYGLGVSVYSRDKTKAISMTSAFNDGSVFINAIVRSDPRLPFGGTGLSGYGRELSRDGLMAFVNRKTVYIT